MMPRITLFVLLVAVLACSLSSAFVVPSRATQGVVPLYSTTEKNKQADTSSSETLDETTEKYGLEVGLFQSLQKSDGGESAKSLLKRYGIAYLATSIPLAIISFALCYALVDSGVNVAALLEQVGLTVNSNTETAGTVALAYAAHKAASPIRFPPTVLLTPVVAKWIGKEPNNNNEENVAMEE